MSLHKGNRSVSARSYSDGQVSRTAVSRYFKWRSTFNAGYLIPFWCDSLTPGQKKSVELGELVRSITPLGPTMDNAFLEIFFFSVPRRLLWDHWEEFIAGYHKEAWAQDVTYTAPKIKFRFNALAGGGKPDSVYNSSETRTGDSFVHSFLDYLPGACDVRAIARFQDSSDTKETDYVKLNKALDIDAMFPRAYVKIWNDWFRSEVVQDEYELYTGDDDQYADEFAFDLLDPASLPKAGKLHNRFTDALPSPVKGPDVLIPMKNLEIVSDGPVTWYGTAAETSQSLALSASLPKDQQPYNLRFGYNNNANIHGNGKVVANNVSNTIRMLRLATQTELLLSRDARGGTRYNESIYSHFHVSNGDARLQRSEYLGSRQIPLQVYSVTNTAQSDSGALGNVGGQSVTKDNAHYFSYSAKEHCIVFCVAVVRTNLSYSSGVRKMYQRFGRFDHIWPEFRHLGDVPLYTRELDTFNASPGDVDYDPDHVFGYTPYGSELREGYNFNNGLFRPNVTGSLAYLTYQEVYDSSAPALSAEYIEQPTEVVSNTLADQNGPQFYGLFELHSVDVIPLDPTSDPGLMDHF